MLIVIPLLRTPLGAVHVCGRDYIQKRMGVIIG